MKQTLIALLLITLLTACAGGSPVSTPAPTVDFDATISAMSEAIIAGTLTAQPTATLLPTETITPTPLPTDTPIPTLTLTPTVENTPETFIGCFAPAGVGNIETGIFRMENNTKEEVRVNLNGLSLNKNKTVNCAYIVNLSFNVEIIWADYNFIVQIGNKKTFTGTFTINNSDKTTMRIYTDKVKVVGP